MSKKIIYHLYPGYRGGVAMVIKELTKRLSIKGFKINIITSDTPNNELFELEKYGVTLLPTKFYTIREAYFFPSFKFVKYIKSIRNSIVHIHGYHTLASFFSLLFIDKKTNLVIFQPYFHGRSGNKIRNLLLKFYRYIFNACINKIDTYIFISHYEKANFRRHFFIGDNKIYVIPSGFDFEELLRHKWKKRSAQVKNILYVGRIVEHKNVDKLIKALIYLDKDVRLTIIGKGPKSEEIKYLIEKLKVKNRIKWISYLPREKLLQEYSKADLFVLPSTYESFGLVIGEAALIGCPVIVASSQALKQFVDHKIAYGIEPPITSKKIYEAIVSMKLVSPRKRAIKYFKDWNDVVSMLVTKVYYESRDK
ncbi:MAG: glycosyltransferase family 4 protein [Actinobacteria bacterium]|nr:glycosyltransferase family 4 protein [Actinomycetota bacterium]